MKYPSSIQRGFTLIEVMVVIVIVSILASLIVLNVGGVDQRKAMQFREVFLMDMQRLLRESNDQTRILALSMQQATDVSPAQYRVVEYQFPSENQSETDYKRWLDYTEFKPRAFPEKISFKITTLDHTVEGANNNDLMGENAPELIWLGNGEVRPARIQFYFEERAVGAEIEIDHLGKINES